VPCLLAISATITSGLLLSAANRARSAFVRRRRPLGPSITSSRETTTPIEPSKWTPILPSLSKAKPSAAYLRQVWPGQINNGRRWSAPRLLSNDAICRCSKKERFGTLAKICCADEPTVYHRSISRPRPIRATCRLTQRIVCCWMTEAIGVNSKY